MQNTLFVSDLDGTLLTRRDRLSAYTVRALNRLLERGLLFTFATARSWHSAHVVAEGLSPSLPWIVHNGAAFSDGKTGVRTEEVFFTHPQREAILDYSAELGIWPLTYAMLDGRERVFYLDKKPRHAGMDHYVTSRAGDPRLASVSKMEELFQGETYYFTFIHDREPLTPLYERVQGFDWLNLTFQRDLYREEYWLEITPQAATKAHAALRLKEQLGCTRLVAFGDAMNDLPLFEAADESYAVANAMPEVKAAADGIIGSNEEDGVAKFLLERMGLGEDME